MADSPPGKVSRCPRELRKVQTLAKVRRTSANRALVELIESGLESKEAEKRRFFELSEKLAASTDGELRRMTFGE